MKRGLGVLGGHPFGRVKNLEGRQDVTLDSRLDARTHLPAPVVSLDARRHNKKGRVRAISDPALYYAKESGTTAPTASPLIEKGRPLKESKGSEPTFPVIPVILVTSPTTDVPSRPSDLPPPLVATIDQSVTSTTTTTLAPASTLLATSVDSGVSSAASHDTASLFGLATDATSCLLPHRQEEERVRPSTCKKRSVRPSFGCLTHGHPPSLDACRHGRGGNVPIHAFYCVSTRRQSHHAFTSFLDAPGLARAHSSFWSTCRHVVGIVLWGS